MDQVYFLYRHIRLDNGEVFYIGKGKANMRGRSEKVFYGRAFSKTKKGRNNWWHKIISKTNYTIEIIFESFNENLINQKEREFIKLYGRRDLGEGSLVNLSDGGEGSSNQIASLETRKKMRDYRLKMNAEPSYIQPRSLPIFVYKTNGLFYKEFSSLIDASRELNITRGNIHSVLTGKFQQVKNFIFKRKYEGETIFFERKVRRNSRAVLCYSLDGEFVAEFPSIADCGKFVGTSSETMFATCKRGGKHKGYLFRFKS